MENKTVDLEKTYLGIELGSTRIKAVLIDERFASPAYRATFPPHWSHIRRARSPAELTRELDAFWSRGGNQP